ncbi:hypothetical protein PINS_up007821 [Pythium insidiosum]|nr:hypothetical protein PINS_up007821 [Pythium insidiosum]
MQLIEEKLISPGAKKLYVSYYRKRVYADLLADGSIRFKDTLFISPVPCALQMKRTLNPSLKTDAGWSTMFSAATGESLKDIKDRLNIRKRGPNSRTVNKEKKLAQANAAAAAAAAAAAITPGAPIPHDATTGATKTSGPAGAAATSGYESSLRATTTVQRCTTCKRDASSDYATCTACKCRTHLSCALPRLEKTPAAGSWFCDSCLTDQAERLLDFLHQARRVLSDDSKSDKTVVLESDGEQADAPSSPQQPEAEAEDAQIDGEQPSISPQKKPPSVGQLDTLLDRLIQDLSSREKRTDIITSSTGATLVHLAKTKLLQLIESGSKAVDAAQIPVSEASDDEDNDAVASTTPAVEELIRLFDLRHDVLQARELFDRTTSTLAAEAESRQAAAERELMALEETRTVEAMAVHRIEALIDKYTTDLKHSNDEIRGQHVVLQSMAQRRQWIRSRNLAARFVPAYRVCAKQMLSGSERLLETVLLDRLREAAQMIEEWNTMESHFTAMSATLNERLAAMKVKSEGGGDDAAAVTLFARVKIPPSRRLMLRQLTNYEANLRGIERQRARLRRTLAATLKIARQEQLSREVTDTTEQLLLKSGGSIEPEAPAVETDAEIEPVKPEEPSTEAHEAADEEGAASRKRTMSNSASSSAQEQEKDQGRSPDAKRPRVDDGADRVKTEQQPATETSPPAPAQRESSGASESQPSEHPSPTVGSAQPVSPAPTSDIHNDGPSFSNAQHEDVVEVVNEPRRVPGATAALPPRTLQSVHIKQELLEHTQRVTEERPSPVRELPAVRETATWNLSAPVAA